MEKFHLWKINFKFKFEIFIPVWQTDNTLNNLEGSDFSVAISYKMLDAHSATYQIYMDSRWTWSSGYKEWVLNIVIQFLHPQNVSDIEEEIESNWVRI